MSGQQQLTHNRVDRTRQRVRLEAGIEAGTVIDISPVSQVNCEPIQDSQD